MNIHSGGSGGVGGMVIECGEANCYWLTVGQEGGGCWVGGGGLIECGEGCRVFYVIRRPIVICLQLDKACYSCSRFFFSSVSSL